MATAAVLCWLTAIPFARAQAPPDHAIVADVVISGAQRIPAETIRSMLKTRAEAEYFPDVLEQDMRALYATGNYSNVQCDRHVGDGGKVTVFFFVREAPRVERVMFNGARHLKDRELEELTGIREGGPNNPTVNRRACEAIVRKLNEQGRPFARCQLVSGGSPNERDVIFNVDEGPRVKIGTIRFVGNATVEEAKLASALRDRQHLGAGMTPYSPEALEAYYHQLGYRDAGAGWQIAYLADGKTVDLTYHIHEGNLTTISPEEVRDAIRRVRTYPGDGPLRR
jgi:outer membrane protein insertion porin family